VIITEENYFSPEAEAEYMGSSQYRSFCGTIANKGCEAYTIAKIKGDWKEEPSDALLVGSYVDQYYTGDLPKWIAAHPKIMDKKGTKKALFVHADKMCNRADKDDYFLKTVSGGDQVIMTGEFAGLKWKIKIDSYHKGIAIVDLKTTKNIRGTKFVRGFGYVSFVQEWGYDIQMAIYQKIVEINSGEKLPVLLACISKEDEPDIEVIGIDQGRIDQVLSDIEAIAPRIIEVKHGGETPFRCGRCDYCKSTKKLTRPIHYMELLDEDRF